MKSSRRFVCSSPAPRRGLRYLTYYSCYIGQYNHFLPQPAPGRYDTILRYQQRVVVHSVQMYNVHIKLWNGSKKEIILNLRYIELLWRKKLHKIHITHLMQQNFLRISNMSHTIMHFNFLLLLWSSFPCLAVVCDDFYSRLISCDLKVWSRSSSYQMEIFWLNWFWLPPRSRCTEG